MTPAPEPLTADADEGGRAHAEADRLAQRFAAGAPGSLEAVYAAHATLVHSYCRRMLDPARAADATQEVFLAAWRSRERYRPDAGTLSGWLMGIARFKVVDIQRADGRQPAPAVDPLATSEGTPSWPTGGGAPVAVESPAAAIGERMLVAEALDELSPRSREMVRLAFFEDLTHAEIAERTQVPLGTVKSDIRRGLAQMRAHLGGFDDAPR